ncbi:MAG: LPXTG cell wall anchor domain-containing protein [Lachnospiraceae bacterium]
MAVLPTEEVVELPEPDVPLADVPATGDALPLTWLGSAATALAGLFGIKKNKKKDD